VRPRASERRHTLLLSCLARARDRTLSSPVIPLEQRELAIAVVDSPAAPLDGVRRRLRGIPGPVLAAIIVLALAAGLVGVDSATAAGRVRHGVKVGGVDLSGLTPSAAAVRLQAAAGAIQALPIEVAAGSASTSLSRGQAGVELDIGATVASAMAVGRDGLVDGDRLVAWTRGVEVPWRARVNDVGLSRLLADLNQRAGRPSREPALRVGTGAHPTVELVEGSPGTAVDVVAARSALAAAAAAPGGALIDLPVTEAQPSVTAEAAEAALAQARGLLDSPVTVRVEGERSQLLPSELAPLVESKAVGGQLRVGLDQKGLDQLLRRKAPFAYTAGRDASFRTAGSSVSVVPAVAGRSVQPGPAATALLAVATRRGGDRDIVLPVASSQPALTTAKAKALGVKERVSSFTTTFSAGDVPRVHNIGLIAASMNRKLVLPGDVFSMNAATGERTAGKGYRTAHVIVDGELVDGLGGGVCQAGTTMFNAALMAGLPVLERRNHSLHISHYPLGRDATLNWPGTDLKFRNDSPYGIYITSSWTTSSLTFTLWSTSRHYKVSLSTSATRNFRSPPTRYEDDPTMPKGTETVEEPGSPGFDVTVFRTVSRGGQVVRRDQFVSNYVPWTRIVRRGTGETKHPGPTDPPQQPATPDPGR
jgi:vancomycin resistance protein YoaR